MKTTMNRILALMCFCITVASYVRAEDTVSELTDPNNVVIRNQEATSNSNANTIANDGNHLVNTNNIVDKINEDKVKGRDDKAQDAERQANAGKGAAMAAGIALTATGTPMLASPFLSVRLTGAALLAMAGLEFAQMGASAGAAGDNKGQKDTLRKDDGQSGAQANGGDAKTAAQNEAADALRNNKQLQDTLAKNGVNSEDFAKQLSSGNLTNTNDVLKAMGVNAQATPEQLAKAEQDAMKAYSGSPEPLGDQKTMSIGMDTSAKDRGDKPLPSEFGISGVSGGPKLSQSNGGNPADANGFGKPGGVPVAVAPVGANGHIVEVKPLIGPKGLSLQALIAQYLGLPKSEEAAKAIILQKLETLGIQKLNGRQNIFQAAHRNFRSFGKWRKNLRVALRK